MRMLQCRYLNIWQLLSSRFIMPTALLAPMRPSVQIPAIPMNLSAASAQHLHGASELPEPFRQMHFHVSGAGYLLF